MSSKTEPTIEDYADAMHADWRDGLTSDQQAWYLQELEKTVGFEWWRLSWAIRDITQTYADGPNPGHSSGQSTDQSPA